MNSIETPEAIIVVGPFLWKCVNCNLLLSRQHSIDDHLASYHKSSLRPDEPTNARCGLAVCGCHKSSYITEGRKEILLKRHARKRKISIPSDQEETHKVVKVCSSPKTLQEEDEGSTVCEETDGNTVENSKMNCKDNAIDKENDIFNEKADKDNNAEDHAGNENRTKSCGDSDSENDVPRSRQFSVDSHVDEEEILASEGRIEREAKHKLDEQDSQSTRKSRRSTKGKNSLYHEYEMGLS